MLTVGLENSCSCSQFSPISALGQSLNSDQTFHKAAAAGYEAVIKVKNVNEMNFDIKRCPVFQCTLCFATECAHSNAPLLRHNYKAGSISDSG